MVGVDAPVLIVIVKKADAFGPHLHIREAAHRVAQQHIARRAGAVLGIQRHTLGDRALLQRRAFERIVREAGPPLVVVELIGEVAEAVLVHPVVAQLPGEGEHDRAWPPVAGFDVQDEGEVGVLGFQILILPGQRLPIRRGRAGQRERRAALTRDLMRGLEAGLAQHGFFKSQPRAVGQPAHFLYVRRAERFDERQQRHCVAAQRLVRQSSFELDPLQVFADEVAGLRAMLAAHLVRRARDGEVGEGLAEHHGAIVVGNGGASGRVDYQTNIDAVLRIMSFVNQANVSIDKLFMQFILHHGSNTMRRGSKI